MKRYFKRVMFDDTILIMLFKRSGDERDYFNVIWSSNGKHVGMDVSYTEKQVTELTEEEALLEIL